MTFENEHCAIPFAFGSYVEQDSREEIIQNIWTILSYVLGERDDLPGFGISDQALREQRFNEDPDEIRRAIERWEPRAVALIEEEPELIDGIIASIQVRVEDSNG